MSKAVVWLYDNPSKK